MSLDFSSSAGNLFNAIGKIGILVNDRLGNLGNAAPSSASAWGASGPTITDLGAAVTAIGTQLNANATLKPLVDTLYSQRDLFRDSAGSYLQQLQALARGILLAHVNADVVMHSKTDATEAIKQVFAQMTAQSYKVTAPTVSATSTAGTNNGTGVCPISVLGPTGFSRVSAFAETIDLTCNNDSQAASALLGVETFTVHGDAAASNPFAFDWPAGSGLTSSLAAIKPGSAADLLSGYGAFDVFAVANVPDGWTVVAGAAGTDFLSEGTTVYDGLKAFKIVGTGAAVTPQIRRDLTSLMKANTVYAGNVWIRDTGAGLLAGVLRFALTDGSSVIADDATTANSVTRAFGDTTGTYTAYSFWFRTPRVMPTLTYFDIKATTDMTSGEGMYIDRLVFREVPEVYAGGPFAAMFSGATKFVKEDTFALAVSNDHAGRHVKLWERLFGLRALGLRLPTTGSNTIADSLVL